MLQCYNRGCGQQFDPEKNSEESCVHHPGEPYFHDAYKGWTCCKKKTVNFTEFLNMKGCTTGPHSNEKPPEPEKPNTVEYEYEEPAQQEIRKPIQVTMKRPPFESQLIPIEPSVVPAFKETIDALVPKAASETTQHFSKVLIEVGTSCKNGGCQTSYQSPETDETECQHHPGVPIFHEGMKYWSCCNKKTSDFDVFMKQAGCTYGKHKWIKDDSNKAEVTCRYDWHQTASNVIVAIYAKLYHYAKSTIKVNPIRLNVSLVFPEENDAKFNLDLELRGIIKPEAATAKMFGTKVEITMPKAEPGSWANLNFPRTKSTVEPNDTKLTEENNADSDSDVDLDDIEPIRGVQIKNL